MTLLTARTVAERLDVSAETILRWQRRGELPAIRLPHRNVGSVAGALTRAWRREGRPMRRRTLRRAA